MKELCRAKVPNEEIINCLTEALPRLSIKAQPYMRDSGDSDLQDTVICEAGDLINKLGAHLSIDHSENLIELDENVDHEYIVLVTDSGSLRLITRLSPKKKHIGGSISYGPEILRISDAKYLFWPE